MKEGIDFEQGWINPNTGEHGHFENDKEVCDGIDLKIVKDQIERMKPTVVWIGSIGWFWRGSSSRRTRVFYMSCGSCRQDTEIEYILGKGIRIRCQHCKILNENSRTMKEIVEGFNTQI